MKQLLLTCVLSCALLLSGGLAQAAAPPDGARVAAPPGDDLRAALQPVLGTGAPGAIALVRHGQQVRRAAVGSADLGTGRPMGSRDHVRIGSVTKTFVAVIAMQLAAEHRLRLDDPLSRWLPTALPYGNKVTIRELLNHTSGIPEYLGQVAQIYASHPASWLRHWTPQELVSLVAHRPQSFPAGSKWHYSNTDYVLVGMIVERATGRSLAEEIDERILKPLDLRQTSLPDDQLTLPPPAAHGYLRASNGARQDVTSWNPSAAWAAGAMISTLDDLARFYRALLTGALLPPEELRQMLTYVDAGRFGYGLGIFAVQTPCGPAIGHNGAVFGYVTDVFTSPDGSRQVALTTNLQTDATWHTQESLITRLFCGRVAHS